MELSAPANRLVMPSPSGEETGAPALLLETISCRFGTVVALDNASLCVQPGTVHALLGENGAGKTTLMRVAFGLQRPDAGRIQVRGIPQVISSPASAIALGIGMVHQHFTLVPAMTVAENVALGGRGRFDPHAAEQRVRDVATRAGLSIDPRALVAELSVGEQQRCEIIKALARDVQLLILDEPTAVLAPNEAAELLRWIRGFADHGGAVVLITHKLRDALLVADDVTVLRNGRLITSTAVTSITEQQLMTAMVGERLGGEKPDVTVVAIAGGSMTADGRAASRAVIEAQPTSKSQSQHHARPGARHDRPDDFRIVLSAQNVRYVDKRGTERLRDATLHVHAGEIVGIAAVEGAGHFELLRILAGRLEPTSGRVVRPERIGYIPEDRHRDALMLNARLDENMALKGAGARTGTMPWRAIRAATSTLLKERGIVASGIHATARMLSGGNQQKLVLGRELADQPPALVAVNPSRGLDFQATKAIHIAIRSARDAGSATVVYSSDLDEVLLLADRVFAMFNGQLVETARDRDAVGNAILGLSQ